MEQKAKNSRQAMIWCLQSVIGALYESIDSLGHKIMSGELNDYLHSRTKGQGITSRQINQMVYDLKRRNYICSGEGDSVILTDKAKIKIIDQVVQTKRKDGKYRFVSFDIPEAKRQQRDNFRLAIKRMGFRQIQKSLWACDYNLGDLVELAITEYKVADYVAYFVAETSNIDDHIAKVLKRTDDNGDDQIEQNGSY